MTQQNATHSDVMSFDKIFSSENNVVFSTLSTQAMHRTLLVVTGVGQCSIN